MYSLIAFLITLTQLLVIGGSYLMQSETVFSLAVVYGSPFYLVMNLLGRESALWDVNPIYIALLCYHIIKYFLIFRAQLVDERNLLRTGAVVFEAFYLALSGYYIN